MDFKLKWITLCIYPRKIYIPYLSFKNNGSFIKKHFYIFSKINNLVSLKNFYSNVNYFHNIILSIYFIFGYKLSFSVLILWWIIFLIARYWIFLFIFCNFFSAFFLFIPFNYPSNSFSFIFLLFQTFCTLSLHKCV